MIKDSDNKTAGLFITVTFVWFLITTAAYSVLYQLSAFFAGLATAGLTHTTPFFNTQKYLTGVLWFYNR
jgi:hypothetical protein